VGVQAHADGLAAFLEVAARTGRVTLDVMGPGQVRLQVHTQEGVRVVPHSAQAVAPRVGGGETVVLAVATQVALVGGVGQRAGIQRLATTIGQRSRPEDRVTAVTLHAGIFQAPDVSPADLAHHRHARGAHDLIEEVGEGGLHLGDFLELVAMARGAGRGGQNRYSRVQRGQGAVQDVGGGQLNRRIRSVADFTLPRGAGGQRGGEAQAIVADVFGILDEVVAGACRGGRGDARACKLGCLTLRAGQYHSGDLLLNARLYSRIRTGTG